MQKFLTQDAYAALFSKYGLTSESYLADHYERFKVTLREFSSTWKFETGQKVLDIGAHWLHQAVLWNQAGFEVLAFDLPGTFEVEGVKNMAEDLDIFLLKCPDMEKSNELAQIPDHSIDVALFSEILEHITFNPVIFWRQIYRVMKPGGKIIVTTPNYYSSRGRAWNFIRYMSGRGGGISVKDVLGTHTYAHHWREYSMSEIVRYFEILSPDFKASKTRYLSYSRSKVFWRRTIQAILELVPFLRPNLHVEIELEEKSRGIVVEPKW